jgi:hypothetical protein
MRKIPTLFKRGSDGRVVNEITPGCEWVLAGEGIATRKWDGACCMVRDGKLFKRREVKIGKSEPPGFELVETDTNTSKLFGWVPVGAGPEDAYFREAFKMGLDCWYRPIVDGTYELCGPKVQGDPERFGTRFLVPHVCGKMGHVLKTSIAGDPPREFDGLREYLEGFAIEGIVFQHPDGRMAKIKGKDYGIKRG